MAGHVTGQTRFGHVTFPRSRASEVPESRFVTPDGTAPYGAQFNWKGARAGGANTPKSSGSEDTEIFGMPI